MTAKKDILLLFDYPKFDGKYNHHKRFLGSHTIAKYGLSVVT